MPDLCCWQCRYSSCEMLYMELRGSYVVTYLNRPSSNDELFSFDEVLAGEQDAMISQLFGAAAVDEVKAAIVAQRNAPPPPTKEQLRERRRAEQRDLEARKRPGWPGRQQP